MRGIFSFVVFTAASGTFPTLQSKFLTLSGWGEGGGSGPRFFVFFVSFVAALEPLRDAATRRSRTGSEVDARRAQPVAAALDTLLDDADLP